MSKAHVAGRAHAGSGSNHRLIDCVADATRRQVLAVLSDRTSPIDTGELATRVTAAVEGEALVDVTREASGSTHVSLVHAHLPKLSEAGLVQWDPDAETVAPGDHPALDDPAFRRLLDVDADDWDDVLRKLRGARRRLALSVLADAGDLSRRTLARRVVARERDVDPDAVPDEAVDDARIDLYHVHLPGLEQVGLVELDGETVRYVGHPALDPEWLDRDFVSDGAAVRSEQRADVWTITGREAVAARGREIYERADDELFVLVTADGLLDGESLDELRDAVDRGVDVYVGSQDEAVRERVRQRAPGATVWEPALDWFALPDQRETLSRIAFADREAVMLATITESARDGARETAVTGDGPRNAVVVLMRELLGTRLDALDPQDDDVREALPL